MQEKKCDILVLQETHRGLISDRPKILGMSLILERSHDKYGSAIFTKPNIIVHSSDNTCHEDVEILTIFLHSCSVTSVYKPPNTDFKFIEPKIVIGDFNCHSVVWGYHNTNRDGEILE